MVNLKIEISPSDRAVCRSCNKFIGKGTPRLKQENPYKNHLEQRYFCYKCSLERIEFEIKSLKGIYKQDIRILKNLPKILNSLIKKNQKEIVLMELG